MAEPEQISTSSYSIHRELVDAATSSSSQQLREEYEEGFNQDRDRHRHPELHQQHIGVSYRGNLSAFEEPSFVIRDDTWSCVIVVLTFWFFVSMTLILGVYGSVNLRLGPNSSILIQPNSLFLQSIEVNELDDTKQGLILQSFYSSPSLDVVTTWDEIQNVSIPSDSHKEWIYSLNEGSEINISYIVNTPNSSIFLIIAQGNEGLAQWLADPTYPNTTLSWNIIQGSGIIHQDIYKASSYYIAVGNLNSDKVEVQLNLRVKALMYNTTESYYNCTFTSGLCTMKVLFPEGNAAVLTSPGLEQGAIRVEQYVTLSYGPRWITYIIGTGGMTVLMLLAFNFLNKFPSTSEDITGVRYGEVRTEREPLLRYKDDDLLSWGSSYESASNDEQDLEDFKSSGAVEGKASKDGEININTRRLCAICFDAPRDCFFLPCGHCVACFECGTRISDADGTCPVCCRNMKKVRKIFTV